METTKIVYFINDEKVPYIIKLGKTHDRITLKDFKNELKYLNQNNLKYFFQNKDNFFGYNYYLTLFINFEKKIKN
jgi:hypothetical protein